MVISILLSGALLSAAVYGRPPIINEFTPLTLATSDATLKMTVSDPDGATDISALKILIHHGIGTAGACYLTFDTAMSAIALRNDADTAWGSEIRPATSDRDSNSQCEVDGSQSSVATTTDNLTLAIRVRFKEPFSGLRRVWVQVLDKSGQGSGGWTWQGDWIVPASVATAATVAAILRSDGTIPPAAGAPSDCLRTDGSTTPCYLRQRVERVKPVDLTTELSISQMPAAETEPKIYRNGILLTPGEDYTCAGQTLKLVDPVTPGDIMQVEYWTLR